MALLNIFMLLSEQYRRLLEHEHSTTPWGVTGWHHAPQVLKLAEVWDARTLLDYGAGRGSLGHWFDKNAPHALERREYEPGIARLSADPQPADMVACIDVMEHIETECVISVLDHIQSLAIKCVYFNISCRLAGRKLRDGRNAHLTVQAPEWWLEHLTSRWQEHYYSLDTERQAFNWFGLFRA